MKTLTEYIIESLICEVVFSGEKDWSHSGAYDYADQVLTRLINGEDLKTGNHGDGELLKADLFDKEKLKDLQNSLLGSSYKELNACLKKPLNSRGSVWNTIYKGVFSGYDNPDKNKGNAFEHEYICDFATRYKAELEEFLGTTLNVTGDLIPEGSKNKKRPLFIDGEQLYATPKEIENVGKFISDVTIPLEDDKKIYLSLKFGDSVTFINCGVNNKNCFPKKAFIDNDTSKTGPVGKYIVNMLGIDIQKMFNVFRGYKGKTNTRSGNYDITDVTDSVDMSKLMTFIKSVIGYGYILVHKDKKNNAHYYDLMSPEALDNFIGNITSVSVHYPLDGTYKRINVYVITDKLKLNFNIRSKDGSTYPTHMMSDYKILGKS